MILLKNCRLVPALSGGLDVLCAAVTVRDGKIEKITETATADAQPSEKYDRIIDCRGMTLLPGLIDLHVHISTAGCGTGVVYTDDFDLIKKACKSAKQYAAHGFTTIRDMGSTNAVANTVRDMIREGVISGPRIFSSGKIIMPAGLLDGPDRNTAYHSISGIEEMKRAVREEVGESRADVVKIYASGSAYNPGGEPTKAILTQEEIAAAVEMAEFRGRKVAAHCHSNIAVRHCIDAGVYTIEHASFIDKESIGKLISSPHTSYLVPTMTPYSYVRGSNPDAEFDQWSYEMRRELGSKIAPRMRAAYEAGLELGFGTDVADGDYRTNGVGAEFRLRKEACGMQDLDILRQATIISAKILGIDDEVGEIKEGYRADLILVKGRPDQDISALYVKPVLTICNGEVLACNNK